MKVQQHQKNNLGACLYKSAKPNEVSDPTDDIENIILSKANKIEVMKNRVDSKMSSGYLVIMSLNANGLNKRRVQLETYLDTNEVDICFIQETKNSLPTLLGYCCELIDSRPDNNGGGLCAYIREGFDVALKWKLENNITQAVGIMINDTMIINTYRPPQANSFVFREDNEKFWKSISGLPYKNIIMTGDFNLRYTNVNAFTTNNGPPGRVAIDELEKKHFVNLIETPTHRDGGCLDWLLTTNNQYIMDVEVDKHSGIGSDHYPVLFRLIQPGMRLTPNYIVIRKLSTANWQKFRRDLGRYKLHGDNINDKMKNFASDLLKLFDKIAPKRRVSTKNRLPHDTKETLALRDEIARMGSTKKLSDDEKQVRREKRQKLANERLKERIAKEYGLLKMKGNSAISRYRRDVKKTIKKLKDKDGNIYTEPKQIVEMFRKDLQEKNIHKPKQGLVINYMPEEGGLHDYEITLKEIEEVIDNLRLNSASGPDDINPTMLKKGKTQIARILLPIFNEIVKTGIYPECWKETTITPILKKGSPTSILNYRNIQCSSCVGKIFEAILQKHVYEYAEKENLFPRNQHGFRRKRSVLTNLLEFYSKVTESLDNRRAVDVIYIDFSDAFGKMDHEMLVHKLANMKIRGNVLKLIESYLSNRRGKFKQGETRSEDVVQCGGSPQGGLLSPCLFALFTADLEKSIRETCSDSVISSYYADDSKLARTVEDSASKLELQLALNMVIKWTGLNKMQLNAKKTKVLHIGNNNPMTKYHIGNEEVEPVQEMRDLGLVVNRTLTWNSHIEKCICKARSKFMEIRNKFYLPSFALFRSIYQTYIEPILLYAAPIWSGSDMETLMPLIRFQQYLFRNRSPKQEELDDWIPYDIITRANMLTLSMCHSIVHGHAQLDATSIFTNLENINKRTLELTFPRYRVSHRKSDFAFPKYAKSLWKRVTEKERKIYDKLVFKKNVRPAFKEPRSFVTKSKGGYYKCYPATDIRAHHVNERYHMAYGRGLTR